MVAATAHGAELESWMFHTLTITSRPYGNVGDLASMLELASTAWAAEGIHEYPRGQICWELPRMASPSDQVRLWEDNSGHLLGFALFYLGLGHGHVVLPGESAEPVQREILQWSEHRCVLPGGLEPMVPDAVASDRQTRRIDVLLRCGYCKIGGDYMPVMRQALGRPVGAPTLPSGYVVRSIDCVHDLPRRVAVQRAAFGARTVTNEANYAQVMQTPDYRRALDVVVVAPDGTFVAFCLGWYDPSHRMGMIEPVGTDPGRREKGFARAAVLEVLRCFQMMGAEVAQVCHDLDNVAARRLYECVGFREEERLYKYRKALR